jgi:hypothetical protein
MKKKIATLDVYVDSESTESCGTGNVEPQPGDTCRRFQLTMNKGEGNHLVKDGETFRTVMAHELGHFLCMVTDDKSHDPMALVGFSATQDTSLAMPAEVRAWEFAYKIYPQLDIAAVHSGLHSYENLVFQPSREQKLLAKVGKIALAIKHGARPDRTEALAALEELDRMREKR